MGTAITIDETIYESVAAEAARRGETVSHMVEAVLRDRFAPAEAQPGIDWARAAAIDELREKSNFQVGPHPTRDEMNER